MATISNLNRGSFIRYNGNILQVEEIQHRTPGNLRAFYQLKMRNVRNGKIVENRFRPGDQVDQLKVDTKEYQYLYQDNDNLVCMDNTSYEQVYIHQDLVGSSINYIKEGISLLIAFDETQTAITVQAPPYCIHTVSYTEPGIQGDTATKTLKPATLNNGTKVRVPLFINIGDSIKIKTDTGEYVERIKE